MTTCWVETAPDGSFTIANVPAGAVTVVADPARAATRAVRVRLPLPQGQNPRARPAAAVRPRGPYLGRQDRASGAARQSRASSRREDPCGPVGGRRDVRRAQPAAGALAGACGRAALRALDPSRRCGVGPARTDSSTSRSSSAPRWRGASPMKPASRSPTPRASSPQGGPINLQRIVRRMRGSEPPTFRTGPDGTFNAARLVPGAGQLLTITHPDFERATVGGLRSFPGPRRLEWSSCFSAARR